MNDYFWLFPIIFIFHDMEEIIGLRAWITKNQILLENKVPKLNRLYKDFSTEGFALAVFEELCLCILLSGLAAFTEISAIIYLWLGAFIGCAFHFLVHIVQACLLKMYIPATITSLICLPISSIIIYNCFISIQLPLCVPLLWMGLGFLIVFANLVLATRLIGWFSRKMRQGSPV